MAHDLQIDLDKMLVLALLSAMLAWYCHLMYFQYAMQHASFAVSLLGGKCRLPFSVVPHPWKNRSHLLVCVYKLVSVLNLSQHEITSSTVKDYLKEFKLIADVSAIKQA